MNEHRTKVSLDEDNSETLTDWVRVRGLDDQAIDAAIAADDDSYALDDETLLGHAQATYRYGLVSDARGKWRWRLLTANGDTVAKGAKSYTSRSAALQAITELRAIFLGAGQVAA